MYLEMAEAIAYNRYSLPIIRGALSVQRLSGGTRKGVRSLSKRFRSYSTAADAADVGALQSLPTLPVDNSRTKALGFSSQR
jgi:hypothetical protein